MIGTILPTLFPDECSVLEIVPNKRFVYPIYKNGTTSLMRMGYPLVPKERLSHIELVEIYVRNPHQRFLSGVQMFLRKLDPGLDKNTAVHFVENYLYLNIHYCPQMFWLFNFTRFCNAKFLIKPIEDLKELTTYYEHRSDVDIDLVERFNKNPKIKFYNEIDEVLTVNLMGQVVSMTQILDVIKSNYPDVYAEVIQRAKGVINVVS
jgi:hypothetical protein